jgi:pimeloyl-[acyl-carrier protein] methyl ester esterase
MQAIYPQAEVLEYAVFVSPEAALEAIAAFQPEHLVGWSLGGVLAVEALRQHQLPLKCLELWSTPFQFMADDAFHCGCATAEYQRIKEEYHHQPRRFISRFQKLLLHGQRPLPEAIPDAESKAEDTTRWGMWLEYLAASSFVGVGSSIQPDAVKIIHGMADAIISSRQAKYWQRIFPNATVILLPEMGHAPHLHPQFLRLM